MPASDEIDEMPYRPSARLAVAITAQGAVLRTAGLGPDRELTYHELAFMAAVDANDGRDAERLSNEFATDSISATDLMSLLRPGIWQRRPDRVVSFPSRTPSPEAIAGSTFAETDELLLRTPLPLFLLDGFYSYVDHDGFCSAQFSTSELLAIGEFVDTQASIGAAFARHQNLGAVALDRAGFDEAVAKAIAANIAILNGPFPEKMQLLLFGDRPKFTEVFLAHRDAQDEQEAAREQATGQKRIRVLPVCRDFDPPLGLGMVIAYAKAYHDGALEEHYHFRTDWFWSDDSYVEKFSAEPAVYLFSNYMWNHKANLDLSEQIKKRSPMSVIIHGGPDTPQYPGDDQNHFNNFPSVDVIVRGEGEATLAETLDKLRQVDFSADTLDLTPLTGVDGICFRGPDAMVRNDDRDRIKELDIIPSPLLTGLFDPYLDIPDLPWLIETNRGCPYGCTFCDWGSATKSRIRKFDLERVYAEIDYTAKARASNLGVTDANFGIFERDVDISQYVADKHVATGHPVTFGANFAKNTKKHLRHIIEIMGEVGMFSQGTLSLQTMDAGTLKEIRRTNIKTEKYDDLAEEMRAAGLPLMIELMFGLPGSTLESVKNDLQECIDREVRARMAPTVMLVNSPMNAPEYREQSNVDTNIPMGPGRQALVVQSDTFTKDDYKLMGILRGHFILFEELGTLNHLSRVIRQEFGTREVDFYQRLSDTIVARPEQFPHIDRFVRYAPKGMGPGGSWAPFYDEIRRFLTDVEQIEINASIETALKVQHALVPTYGRMFPVVVPLEHDYVAWYRAMVREKRTNRIDWATAVPKLSTYSPGDLAIDDPDHKVTNNLGIREYHLGFGADWQFETDLTREGLLL